MDRVRIPLIEALELRRAIGEYDGKFMSGQFMLKGGSSATHEGMAGELT